MEIDIDYIAIGKRIRSARLAKKMTQETLSNMIDVTPTYISTIENGHTKLSLSTLLSIAQILDTTVVRTDRTSHKCKSRPGCRPELSVGLPLAKCFLVLSYPITPQNMIFTVKYGTYLSCSCNRNCIILFHNFSILHWTPTSILLF